MSTNTNTNVNAIGVQSVDALLADIANKTATFKANPNDLIARCELAEAVENLATVGSRVEDLTHRLRVMLRDAGGRA